MAEKVGVTPALTVICIVTCAAQPDDGVKVYEVVPVVDVFMKAGLHVPVILLVDVVGSAGAVAF